jgi:hypothetical protein
VRQARKVWASLATVTGVLALATGCGPNSNEVKAAAAIVRASERTSYDVKILESESAAASRRLPSAIEVERLREEYLDKLAETSAEVFCSQLQTMLDTGEFPSVGEWEQALTTAIVNAALDVPAGLHAATESIVGGTYDYLAAGDGTIETSDVQNAQARFC